MYWDDDYDYYALNWLEARCMGDYDAEDRQCYNDHDEEEDDD